jgi:hypothetical protein
LIKPNRVAFVALLMSIEVIFIFRCGDRHMTQSADRIVGAIRVKSVRKVRTDLMNHDAPRFQKLDV